MTEDTLFDLQLLEEIGARLDLRKANREAVESIVFELGRHYEIDSLPRPFEGVADVATGVGKTYVMAATLDYLAAEGVRNFAVVTPGKTILTKTVNNFSEGHPKSLLSGMAVQPVVITSETFASPTVRAAMDDEEVVKLYIFTVQSLIRPSTKAGRKTHTFQEGLGAAFYTELQKMDDLVVFADEHHTYFGPAFSSAVRDLEPYALIGLTATPHPRTPESQIVYRYPLVAAIADKVVKTPVLVGRADDRTDSLTKLQDGVRLLELKERAIARYASQAGVAEVKPVMLVVAPTIEEANEIERIVEDPSFFDGRYADKVLTVHSNVPDAALEQLESLEGPANPYQIVISVGMLKEGWDVKNVYVIASLRASVSEILTEQTLGRGLRLPFGRYTGIELLDTLEVLGHERYAELLRKANVLNEKFIDRRTRAVLRQNQYGELVPVRETIDVQVPIAGMLEQSPEPYDQQELPGRGTQMASSGLAIREVTSTVARGESEILQLELALPPRDDVPRIRIPYLKMSQVASKFSLSDITDLEPFRQLGRRIAADPSGALRRVTVSARVVTGRDGLRRTELVTAPAVDQVVSPAVTLPLFEAREQLLTFVLHSSVVPARATEERPAGVIVDAFIEGLGENAEAVLSSAMDRAAGELTRLIQAEHHRYVREPEVSESVELKELDRVRRARERRSADRYGEFERNVGYEGYRKSLYGQDWFDSSPERDVANALDEADEVVVWARLQQGDTPILWREAREYNPDFAVVERDGTHWLLEVKADRDMDREDVSAKKRAARRWANHANARLNDGTTWNYGLIGEREVAGANGRWSILRHSTL